jgi:hypothetical protein
MSLTAVCKNVELFDIGHHKGWTYNLGDIFDLVRNHNRVGMRVPVVIGHSEEQPELTRSGLKDAGYVANVRRKGTKLVGDFLDVPGQVARLINQRAYIKVSSELYTDHRFSDRAGPIRGPVLRRVALLGGELPQVKSLADLPFCTSHEPFSEGLKPMNRTDRLGRYSTFEDSPTDTYSPQLPQNQLQTIVAQLQKLLPGLDPSYLSPDVLAQMASLLAPLTGAQYSDTFGPGCAGAGKGDRRFSEGRGITRIYSDAMSSSRRAALMNASPVGRHIVRQQRRGH